MKFSRFKPRYLVLHDSHVKKWLVFARGKWRSNAGASFSNIQRAGHVQHSKDYKVPRKMKYFAGL